MLFLVLCFSLSLYLSFFFSLSLVVILVRSHCIRTFLAEKKQNKQQTIRFVSLRRTPPSLSLAHSSFDCVSFQHNVYRPLNNRRFLFTVLDEPTHHLANMFNRQCIDILIFCFVRRCCRRRRESLAILVFLFHSCIRISNFWMALPRNEHSFFNPICPE